MMGWAVSATGGGGGRAVASLASIVEGGQAPERMKEDTWLSESSLGSVNAEPAVLATATLESSASSSSSSSSLCPHVFITLLYPPSYSTFIPPCRLLQITHHPLHPRNILSKHSPAPSVFS